MNFFEHQDKARRKTKLLIFYFLLAIICIIAAINGLIYGALIYGSREMPELSNFLYEPIWLYVSGAVVLVILAGTLIKTLQLHGGGLSVAKMVNARPITMASHDFKEKQLINIVEEMSIASGVTIPRLFVMDHEPAINAFVAGIKPEDTVLVVTKGALDQLNREELQGVIGHEYSHIFNSDMRINIRLMSILGGILAIGIVGEYLMRSSTRSSMVRRRNDKGGGLAIIALGAGIMVIGYIGLFFGRLIKAAISRQRELLADACSVQYTRYPHGLTSAFRRMQALSEGSKLKSSHSEDISHLCFGQAISYFFFPGLFATHPPLEVRIKAIDPDGKYPLLPEQIESDVQTAQKPKTTKLDTVIAPILYTMAAGTIAESAQAQKQQIKESVGNPTQANLDYAHQIFQLIPEDVLAYAHDANNSEYLFYALLIKRFGINPKIKRYLSESIPKDERERMIEINKQISELPVPVLLPLFEIALSAFSENAPDRRNEIFKKFEVFANFYNPAPFRFALMTLLGKKTNPPKRASDKPKYYSLDSVQHEIAVVASYILNYGYSDESIRQEHFDACMQALFSHSLEKPSIDEFKPIQFRNILEKLNSLAPELKAKLLSTCVDLIVHDTTIQPEEAELLRAIAECLDCPMPVIPLPA